MMMSAMLLSQVELSSVKTIQHWLPVHQLGLPDNTDIKQATIPLQSSKGLPNSKLAECRPGEGWQ